jgi:hypothetical protein
MKKRILSILFVAAIAIAAAWNYSQNQDEVALSDVALENVEALANGESTVDCIIAYCYWSPGDYCDYTCSGIPDSSSNMRNK